MAPPKKDDKNLSPDNSLSSDNQSKKIKNEDQILDSELALSPESSPGLDFTTPDSKVSSFVDDKNQAVLGVVTERVQAITSLSLGVLVPESVIQKIKQNKVRSSKFDASQIVRLQDGPAVLNAALSVDFGFTPDKLRKIAESLDPRIVIVIEEQVFLDKKLLAESFEGYLQTQQENNLLQMSRSSRAALRRNIILRETLLFLEQVLKQNDSFKDKLTKRINTVLGNLYKPMENDDVLAFLESSRINEEKRRLRAQETELERLALEQLEAKRQL